MFQFRHSCATFVSFYTYLETNHWGPSAGNWEILLGGIQWWKSALKYVLFVTLTFTYNVHLLFTAFVSKSWEWINKSHAEMLPQKCYLFWIIKISFFKHYAVVKKISAHTFLYGGLCIFYENVVNPMSYWCCWTWFIWY